MDGTPQQANLTQDTRRTLKNRVEFILKGTKNDKAEALDAALDEIIDAATRAIDLPDELIIPDGYFFSARGFALFKKYKMSHSKEERLLDRSLNDFALAKHGRRHNRTHALALIAKSYLLKGRSPLEALDILTRATGVAKALPVGQREHFEQQIELNIADSNLRLAINSKDVAGCTQQCGKILSCKPQAHSFALPLYYAGKILVENAEPSSVRGIVVEIMQCLDDASRREHISRAAIAQLSSHAASLSLWLGPDFIELCLSQNLRVAEAEDRATAFRYSIIGRLMLQIGKKELRAGNISEAADQFHDAAQWLNKSLSGNDGDSRDNELYDRDVVHSCLGEVYLRLQGIMGGAKLGKLALAEFGAALNNDSPVELVGLIGDAHFRVGRYLKDPDHLYEAVRCKEAAMGAYPPTREALSVYGAALLLLDEYKDRGESLVGKSIDATVRAHHLDPSWPWPFLQLAQIAESRELSTELNYQLCSQFELVPTIDMAAQFRKMAVDSALDNTEFGREVLGGRTKVFVLSDQHKLISSSIVLKPTTIDQAQKELRSTQEFGDFLKEHVSDGGNVLPRPITIKHLGGDRCIYAMMRSEGQTLAEGVIELQERGAKREAIAYLERAVRLLALFHAWRAPSCESSLRIDATKREALSSLAILELKPALLQEVAMLAQSAVPNSLPLFGKKDAHPENWLMTADGIVMLDLEATGTRPALYELVQLLDDYGILPISNSGWRERIGLAYLYIDTLKPFGISLNLDRSTLEASFGTFWALRAGFGIGHSRRRRASKSSSAIARIEERLLHCRRSLFYLEKKFDGHAVASLAKRIASLTTFPCLPSTLN